MDIFEKLQNKHPKARIVYYVNACDGRETINWGFKNTEAEARAEFDAHIEDMGEFADDLHLYKALVRGEESDYEILHDEVLDCHPVNF